MPKIMLHDEAARAALGRGVAKLSKAVRGTLGPKGMNAIIDRPLGTPIVSRDGVSIAAEIELECPFENMGAQVLREVSKQTNEVAGDGTTTATVLADVLVQDGLKCLAAGANPVELVEGLELAVLETIAALKRSAKPLDGAAGLRAVASIAANDTALGNMVAEAFEKAGNHGIVAVEFGNTVHTTLEIIEGMAFERGYLSHHMVTDVEKMQVVLDNPFILMTDHKIQTMDQLNGVLSLIDKSGSQYAIEIQLTSRCDSLTTPVLNTSVNNIEVLGRAQAIQGFRNTLALNPNTYVIAGELRAPLNVDPYDSGATVNWQVWCQPKKTA